MSEDRTDLFHTFFDHEPNDARFHLEGQAFRRIAQYGGAPVERYFLNIIDRQDGQMKILSVGHAIMRQIQEALAQPEPRKKWWQRLWGWLCVRVWFLRRWAPEPMDYDFQLRMEKDGLKYERVKIQRVKVGR